MDPPGHTVFLYLQELNRAELQQQAKLYGIKANQKSEALRQQLQEVLSARDNVKSSSTSVMVAQDGEDEEETRDDDAAQKGEEEKKKDEESPIDDMKDEEEVQEVVVRTPVEVTEEEEKAVNEVKEEVLDEMVAPASSAEHNEETLEQPSKTAVEIAEKHEVDQVEVQQEETVSIQKVQEDESVNEMESKHESSACWVEGEANKVEDKGVQEEEEIAAQESGNADDEDEAENEEEDLTTATVPPQVVIVDLDSDEMAGFSDDSIVSPTAAARKELFRSKIPSGPSASSRRKVLEERSMNAKSNHASKLGKPRLQQFQPALGSVSMIIRNKNSPTHRPPSKIQRKPILHTKTCPRPKAMPLSRRNELQLKKFVERQNRGRKNREEQLKHAEFTNLVRSPGKA